MNTSSSHGRPAGKFLTPLQHHPDARMLPGAILHCRSRALQMVALRGSDQLLLGLPSLRAAPSKRQARAEPQYLARLTTGLGSAREEAS